MRIRTKEDMQNYMGSYSEKDYAPTIVIRMLYYILNEGTAADKEYAIEHISDVIKNAFTKQTNNLDVINKDAINLDIYLSGRMYSDYQSCGDDKRKEYDSIQRKHVIDILRRSE